MVATTISALAAIPTTTLNDAQFENAYPYIGDLEGNVNEAQLLELFGQVVSIRVCKDQTRRSSLGCYVNFASTQDAAKSMEHLNFTHLNGKSIRIMFSH